MVESLESEANVEIVALVRHIFIADYVDNYIRSSISLDLVTNPS